MSVSTIQRHAIDYRHLPSFSRSWHAAIAGDVPQALYARVPLSMQACREAAAEQLAFPRPWAELADVLRVRGTEYGVPDKTLARLAALAQGRAVMVVTGQQVGYLGGPLYTLLKAYHTVRLAAELERDLNCAVLPLFWLEGEDHDLEEVRTAYYADRAGELRSLRYAPREEVAGLEVGRYPVDAALHLQEMAASLDLPHEDGLALLRECYSDTTLSGGMGRLLARVLGPRGLLVVEGMDAGLKQMALPLWERVLHAGRGLGERLAARSSELQSQGWASPLTPTPEAHLFYLVGADHVRSAYTYDGKLLHPRGGAQTLTRETAERLIQSGELCVSPKAALRPLYQDFVLPTVAYVGGPGELDYHAQLTPFYGTLGVVAPSLFPRLSVSLLDARVAKIAGKVGLSFERLLGEERDVLIRDLVREEDDGRTAAVFDQARGEIEALFERLTPDIAAIDPTLEGAAHGAAGKCLHVLSELRQKSERALKQQHGTGLARLDKALAFLRPQGQLAERVFSTGYYLAKFGPEGLLEALDELPADAREHFIIEMD